MIISLTKTKEKAGVNMDYKFLGRSGLRVSSLCLGAMTFGRETSESDSHRMLDMFAAAGGNFVDTANVYSQGLSEEIIGTWLKTQQRDDFVIATKVRFPMGNGPNDSGLGRKHIIQQVEASLGRLKTDYIDLYQVHCQDPYTPLEETLGTLDELVHQGRVRYIGASNFSPSMLQKALDISRSARWEAFISLQAKYNLLVRSSEWELLPQCEREGLGFMVWGPLHGGWLSGRYRRGMEGPPAESRVEMAQKEGWFESWANYNNEHTWKVIDALMEVSIETGRSPAQVALNWLRGNYGVTVPIIGARKLEHLRDNLESVQWKLGSRHVDFLNKASEITLPYPYDMIKQNCC